MKPSSPGKIPVDVPKPAGRILPAEALTSSRAARVPASEAALKAIQEPETPGGGICPVRRAAPFQAWTEAAAPHGTPAIAAVPAVRACHPAVAVAAGHRGAAVAVAGVEAVAAAGVEAGGSHENIPIITTGKFKGEDNDASRNKY